MSGSLAAAVAVGIEAYIDEAVSGLAKLGKLAVVEMRPQRRNGVGKTRLRQSCHVEESFNQDEAGESQRLRPAIKPAFGAGQKTMAVQAAGNRAAVEIIRVGQRKRKTPEEAVTALPVGQPTGSQFVAAVTAPLQMPPQTGAGGVPDAHPLNQ